MINKIKAYVDTAFENAPDTKSASDLKEEIISNLIDKYNDLVDSGKSEEEAYKAVISGIGNVDKLIGELTTSPDIELANDERKKSALLTAIAVGLYIVSVVVAIIFDDVFENENIGAVGMFLIIAVATGILIYVHMTKPRNISKSDDLVEEFIEWKSNRRQSRVLRNAIAGVVWSIAVVIYIITSFLTRAWHITWVIFIIAGAVITMSDAVIKLKGERYE